MVFSSEGNTTIVSQEDISLVGFIKNLDNAYSKIKNNHIVVNLFSFDKISASEIMEFLEISNKHRNEKKSFVLVTDKVTYDDAPDDICVVPTIQEAKDIIEMEDIERDLGL